MGLLEDAVSYAKETQPAQAETGLLEQAVAFAKRVPQAEEPSEPFFKRPEWVSQNTAPLSGIVGINELPASMAVEGAKWLASEVPAAALTVGERAAKGFLGAEKYISNLFGDKKNTAEIDAKLAAFGAPEDTLRRATKVRETVHGITPGTTSPLTQAATDIVGQTLDKIVFWKDDVTNFFDKYGMPDVAPVVQFLTELAAFKVLHKGGTVAGDKAYKALNKVRAKVKNGKSAESVLNDFEKELAGLKLTKEDLGTPEARQAWINRQEGFEDYGPTVKEFQTAEWLRKDSARSKPVNKPEVVPEPPVETPGEPVIVSGAKTPAETNLEAQAQQQQVQQLQRQVEPQSILTRDLPPEARRITEAAQRTPKQEIQEIPPEVSGLDQPVLMTADGRLFYKDGRPVNLEEPAKAAPVEKPVEPVAEPVPVDNSHKNLMEVGELKPKKSGPTRIDLERLDGWAIEALENLRDLKDNTRLSNMAKQLLETGELKTPGLFKTFKKWYNEIANERMQVAEVDAKHDALPPNINRVDPEIGRPPGEGIEVPRKQTDLGTSDLIAEVKQENTPLMRDDGTPIKSRAMAVKRAEALGRIGEVVKNPKGEGWIVKPTKAQRRKMKRQELEAWDKILESEGLTVEETRTASKGVRGFFDLLDNERGSVDPDLLFAPIRKLMEAFGKNPKAGGVLNGLRKSNITKDDLRLSRFEYAISMNYKPQDRIDWKDLIDKAEKGYLDVGKTILGVPEAKWENLHGYNVRGTKIGSYNEHLFTNSKLSDYKEAHWGEHGQGVFAHSRRTPMQLDDGVKALVAHDVQSVLHQKGLAEGYSDANFNEQRSRRIAEIENRAAAADAAMKSAIDKIIKEIQTDFPTDIKDLMAHTHMPAESRKAIKQIINEKPITDYHVAGNAIIHVANSMGNYGLAAYVDRLNIKQLRLEQGLINMELANAKTDSAIPDAPYKADWYKLVMRDQVNEAVRTGMDGIAWTTADFQAKASAGHTSTQVRTLYDEKIPSFIRKEYGVEPVKKTSQGTEVWYAPVGELSTKPLRGNTMLEVISNLLTNERGAISPDLLMAPLKIFQGLTKSLKNERGEVRLSTEDIRKATELFKSGKYDPQVITDALVKRGLSPEQIDNLSGKFIEKAQATGESKWLRPGQDMNEILPRRQKANGNLAPAISRGAAHNLTQAKDMDARALGESWSLETSNRGMERAGEAIKQEFYHPLRKATAEFQKEKKRVFKEVDKIAKTFSQSEKERIYSYATQLQEGGKEILQLQGKEVVTQLTPKELAAYNKMRTDFKAMYDRLNAAREAAGESKFPAVDNYFTLANDIAWLRDEFGIGLYDNYKTVNGYLFGDHKTTPSSFHTKSRAADRQMLGINLYLDKAGHSHKLNGEQVKRVREYAQQTLEGESSIALSPEEMAVYNKAKKVVVKTLNDPFMAYKRYMNESLDYAHRGPELARQKELLSDTYGLHELAPNTHLFLSQWRDAQTGMRLPWDVSNLKWRRRIQRMNKNVVMGYLAGAPQSALRQVGAFPHTFAIAGQHTFGGILDAMSPAKWKMAWEKSDVLHTRSPEVSLDIARGYESQNKIVKVLDKASEAELKPLDIMDKVTATASWLSFYRQAHAMKQFTTDAQRVRYADDWTAKTQGSASMLDRAPIQRSLIGGTATGLQTFAINEFNFIAKDVLGIKNPEINAKTKLARTARFVAAVTLFNWLQEEVLGMNAGAPTPVKTAREKADELGKDGELTNPELVRIATAGLSELVTYVPLIGSALKYDTTLGGPSTALIVDLAKDMRDKGYPDPKTVATLLGRGDVRQALKMHDAYERNGSVMDIMLGNTLPKPREKKGGPVLP